LADFIPRRIRKIKETLKFAKKKQMTENDTTQLLTYLKLSGIKPGLLINFNSKTLKDNIHRVVNNL